MRISRKKQLRYEKYIDQVIIKRDLGVKKYSVDSDYIQEYCNVWNNTYKMSIKNIMITMDNFFNKWNIETRSRKLKQIINNIK